MCIENLTNKFCRSGRDTNESPPSSDANEIFEILTLDKKYGSIQVKKDLKGFYGTWMVTIEAFDHGHQWHSQIQLKSTETYEITIEPFNFNSPILMHPLNGQAYRLRYEKLSFYCHTDNYIIEEISHGHLVLMINKLANH